MAAKRRRPNIARALKEMAVIHAAKPRKKHPLFIALMKGKLKRPQVREYLKQFSAIPLYNHLYHGPLYVSCPDPAWRERLAHVVYEEGAGGLFAGGVPHYKLYLRLGKAFGIGEREMYATDFVGGALAFRSHFEAVCSRGFLEGYSALSLGGEAQVPGVSGKVSDAMKRYYGLSHAQAAFYWVDEDADKDHSGGGDKFLERFCATESDLDVAVGAVRDAVNIAWLMYEDIWDHIN